MTIGKKTLFSLLLGANLLANVLELTQINFLYTTTLISFCTCILLPGFLISLILRIRKVSLWENILFIVGLSIAFLEFGGLLLNTLLPLFGINNPLAFQNLVVGFDVYMLLLFIFAWIRTKQLVIQIRLPRRSKIEKAFYALPLFFPILAALGATVLNNGGSNILTLILLGTIAFYTFLLVLFRNKISVDLYPYAIFFIGLACLFTTSLRGWFITGHDIQQEFYVFQLTNAHHIWNIAFYQDPYNACLSITILPTILTNLLSLQDMYVYKVIFQVLFATSPVLVFFIMRKYTIPVFAFLSAFFFISFPTFLNDMPMINRQEIAFIFFGLVLYMMLLSELPLLMRKILFVIFALSVAVSHYSTYFTFLALIIFVYVFTKLISLSFVKNMFAFLLAKSHIMFKNTFNTNTFLTLPLLLILFFTTYLWYGLYTNTSNQVGSVLSEVVNGIFMKSNEYTKSGDLSFLFFSPKIDPNKQLHEYIQSLINSEEANGGQFYSKAITNKYNSYVIPQEQLPPTPLGNWLTTLHIPVFNLQADLRSFSAVFMEIFVFIAWLAFFSFKRLKEKTIDKIIPPRLSLKMRERLIQQSYIGKSIPPRLSLNMGERLIQQSYIGESIPPRLSLNMGERLIQQSYIGESIPPRLSLKMRERLIQQSYIDKQATLQLPRLARHLPYSDSNSIDDAPGLGNRTTFPKYKKTFDLQFLLLCSGTILLLVLISGLPYLSIEYGVLRMFQQFLFILSLPIVLGVFSILRFVKEQKRILITGIIAIIFFLDLSGFIPHLTGNFYPQMTLDNSGLYYDTLYVHKSDVLAIVWLSKSNINNDPVEADASGIYKLLPYGNMDASDEIFPSVVQKNAYVYLEVSNIAVVKINNTILIINSPKSFYDNNKNLIYSNGTDNIYK
jgi:uncharacterized membrane protein